MNKLDYSYDAEKDIFTIEGVKYSGEFLRIMPIPRQDQLLRVVQNQNGVITFNSYRINLEEFEKWQAERFPV